MILQRGSHDFILGQNLVVVPLYSFSGSRGMVDYVSSVELVESNWSHSFRIILYPGEVHEVDSMVSDVIVLPDLVKNPLVSDDSGVVID